ncbi:MAG: hypothetical protein LBQ12_11390 [Deltaproteobacteria bacterium]|jgi:hypothetical protein|nr:hypothetical protein [Deltaproteobacteria bacterium]
MKSRYTISRPVFAILPALAVLALALAPAAPLSAQESDADMLRQVFENQPPVTAAEVPVALEILAASKKDSPPEETLALGAKAGMDERRVMFVTSKLMAAFLMLKLGSTAEATGEQMRTPLAVPTPEELDVLRPHMDAMATIMELNQ